MTKFWRYELRTTNVAAARDFYRELLGHERAVIWPLHEQALARGARPHWLGHLAASDAELVMRRWLELGAVALGPTRPMSEGGQLSVFRDPGGAILAVTSRPPGDPQPLLHVAYHVLNTKDVARAKGIYCELFGWQLGKIVELGEEGTFQEFAWDSDGTPVGAFGDIEARPGVHPQWLYFFEVASLDDAIRSARAAGGLAPEPMTAPNGARVCVCEDPQGAAFGLQESPSRRA